MKKGFTLVEIMIVVAIIGLLAAIAIPNIMQYRLKTQTETCIANMREIETAMETLASMEGGWTNGSPVPNSRLVGSTNLIKNWPVCRLSKAKGEAGMTNSYGAQQIIGTGVVCQLGKDNDDPYKHQLPE